MTTDTHTPCDPDTLSLSTHAIGLIPMAEALSRAFWPLDPGRILSYMTGTNSKRAFKSVVEYIPEGQRPKEAAPMEPRRGFLVPIISIFMGGGRHVLVTAVDRMHSSIEMQASLKHWIDSLTRHRMDNGHLGERTPRIRYTTYVVDVNALTRGKFSGKETPELAGAILTPNGKLVRPASSQRSGFVEYTDGEQYFIEPDRAVWSAVQVRECHSRITSLAKIDSDKGAIVVNLIGTPYTRHTVPSW